ncbi:MAG: asparagine synthase-related protein [archaeon]
MKLDESFKDVCKLRTDEILTDKKEIIKELERLLVNAVDRRKGEVAIAFSGGLDSTLLAFICSKLGIKFTLYSVGLENAPDLEWARKVAKHYGWKLKYKVLTDEEVEDIFLKLKDILVRKDVVNFGVGAVTYAVCSMVEENILFTGLGSEELFAGYERHKGDINKNCWEGLLGIYDRDIVRDKSIAKSFNIEARCPFLDRDLIEYAMKIDGSLKMNEEFKKVILRETAEHLGMEFCWRKKKAAQYGSYFDKVLERMAKKKGISKKELISSFS